MRRFAITAKDLVAGEVHQRLCRQSCLAQFCRAAQIGQIHNEQRVINLRTGAAQQLRGGQRRAAGGDQVVEDQHPLPL